MKGVTGDSFSAFGSGSSSQYITGESRRPQSMYIMYSVFHVKSGELMCGIIIVKAVSGNSTIAQASGA
jgi:hypothetical protein